MAALSRAAESMRGVRPFSSRALRSSPRSIWIRTALSTPVTTAILRNRLSEGASWAAMFSIACLFPEHREDGLRN